MSYSLERGGESHVEQGRVGLDLGLAELGILLESLTREYEAVRSALTSPGDLSATEDANRDFEERARKRLDAIDQLRHRLTTLTDTIRK